MMPVWTPYCGPGPAPAELWARWNLDPALLAVLAAAVLAVGLWGPDRRARVMGWGAVAVLAISFVSPLCALSSALFSARTVHHLLLMLVAAPLIAGAMPKCARGLLPAAVAQAVVLWAWHAPAAYGTALSSDGAYWVMQLSLLGSAVWFWSALRDAATPTILAGLLATLVQTGLLGAVLTFAPDAVYAPHLLTTGSWGFTPLEDQQIAGLVMWVISAGAYLLFALATIGLRLSRDEAVVAR